MGLSGFSTIACGGCGQIIWIHGSCTTFAPRTIFLRIFGKGGAMKALLQASTEGRVRYLGITGHHDPAILLKAMQEFDFDTVLIPLNAADVHRLSFRDTVLVEAARRNMGIIGMKSTAQGRLLANGTVTMEEAMGYVLSLPESAR